MRNTSIILRAGVVSPSVEYFCHYRGRARAVNETVGRYRGLVPRAGTNSGPCQSEGSRGKMHVKRRMTRVPRKLYR